MIVLSDSIQKISFKGVAAAFRDSSRSLLEWHFKTLSYFKYIENTVKDLEEALGKTTSSKSQLKRMKMLIRGYQKNLIEVKSIVRPLLERADWPSISQHWSPNLNPKQHYLSYEPIIFRDWYWGDKENKVSMDLISAVWPKDLREDVAIWGSGAGRLTYDLIEGQYLSKPLICDLNPYLLFLAEKMFSGDSVTLNEFPINPIYVDNCVVESELKAPKPLPIGDYKFLMCDLTEEVFQKSSLKGILTPWLIDIIADPFDQFIRKINYAIQKGGYWIQFGPLGFSRKNESENLTIEEVEDIAKDNGFEKVCLDVQEVDYLCREESGQKRREKVVVAVFRKVIESAEPRFTANSPDWISDLTLPVPLNEKLKVKIAQLYSESLIMSRVDGKSSIKQMATALSSQLKLPQSQCETLIKNQLLASIES